MNSDEPQSAAVQAGHALATTATALTITDQKSLDSAGHIARKIKDVIDRIHEELDPICAAANRAHKLATSKRAEHLKPAKQALFMVTTKMGSYMQDAKRLDAQREAAERAAAATRAEDELIQAAEAAEAAGQNEIADEILSSELDPEPVVPVLAVAKPEGIKTREAWRYRVTDESAIPRRWLILDGVAVGQYVRTHKSGTNIPGIEAYLKTNVSATAY